MARAVGRPSEVDRAGAGRAGAGRTGVGRALCIGMDADADARLFAALACARGFVEPAVLLGEEATRTAVHARLAEHAVLCKPGDLFLLTFSGHGGRTRLRGQGGELRDVGTWQLYDGTLNDEQLNADLSRFRQGVRIVVVADCCGGGIPTLRPIDLSASVLVLAACEDGRYADGAGLPGHFADTVRRTLNGFDDTYSAFYKALCHAMPPYQQPDFYRLGPPDAAFEAQRPFTI